MSNVSPTQVGTGSAITAASVNTPINQLAAVVNGGLDASNLADNSITPAKLAFMSKTTDLNGWTVYDYGNWKEYAKTYTWSGSQAISAGANFLPPAMVLPTGITNVNQLFVNFNAVANDRVVLINYRTASASSIPWEVSNYSSGTFTLTALSIDVIARGR